MATKKIAVMTTRRVKAAGKSKTKTVAVSSITSKPVCFKLSHTWAACDICNFKDECKPWTRESKN
jgi:hypothetical protein